jgi:glycine betaine/choline ABC-type transport system substrate-binding protein
MLLDNINKKGEIIFMKTEQQIMMEVTTQIINDTRTKLNDEMTKVDQEFAEAYKKIIEQEIQSSLELGVTGITSGNIKSIKSENKKLQQIRSEKEKIQNQLTVLDELEKKS